MELQTIQTQTTWNDAAERINRNNIKIATELTKLGASTYKNKGYFGSIYALQEAYPTSSPGSKAYVGRTYPYTIYIWENNSWIDSGETGGEESVDLSDYYTKEEFDQKVTVLDGKLTELSAKVETLEAQVKELKEQADTDTTAILGKAKLGYAVLS